VSAALAVPAPSRLRGRAEVVMRALSHRAARRAPPADPRRILVAHHLLLGDTLMLTPLLCKLRERHPRADIAMTVPRAYAPLYQGRPYGVRALPWDPRQPARTLFDEAPFDLAFVPGDNRYAWLAGAMRAGWIVAFSGDRPARKSWPVDAQYPYPLTPGAWGDMVATLVDGPPPAPYRPADWPAPAAGPVASPQGRYAVLHVGASSPLKQWLPERWRALAQRLAARGFAPVWSAGPGEDALVEACDPDRVHASLAGRLDLAQLWHLLARAALLVAPDTGVAHLGRLVGVPTVALFGPGSALICGNGAFFRAMPWRAVTIDPFPCRDQAVLFKREIEWVRRCGRSVAECPAHRCMPALTGDAVDAAIEAVMAMKKADPPR
jgi:ADP-heptose:LPS heptosyltransferase